MQLLSEGRCLLEGGAYFNVETQRCDAYLTAALISDPAPLLKEIRQLCIALFHFISFH